MNKNLRWKVLTILAVFVVFFARRGLPDPRAAAISLPAPGWLMAKQLKLGLDLKGGVHLVLRVNTDDALRISTDDDGRAAARGAATAGVTVGVDQRHRRRRRSGSRACRRTRTPSSGASPTSRPRPTTTAARGVGGAYDFTMRPNIARDLREQTMVQAHDTIDRRVNELGVAEPNIAALRRQRRSDPGAAARASPTSRAPRKSSGRPALLELKLVEGGPGADREALLQAHGGKVPADMEVVTGAAERERRRAARRSISSARSPRSPAATCAAPSRRSTRTAGRRSSSRSSRTARGSSARSPATNIGRYLAIVLDNRVQSCAADRRAHQRRGAHRRRLHPAGSGGPRR